MVIAAGEETGMRRESSGMAEKRTLLMTSSRRVASHSRLHNFSFPSLSWGNQKLLRCVNLSNGSAADELDPPMRRSSSSSLDETHQAAASPSRLPIRSRGQKRRVHDEEAEESTPAAATSFRSWNLRTRRAACNAPREIGLNPNPSSTSSPSPSPSPSPLQQKKIINPVRNLRSILDGFDKGDRQKFSIPLLNVEIEEDFVAMKGTKPPRRPKKRAKYLQKQLDILFPGSWLSEVTPDLYKIDE